MREILFRGRRVDNGEWVYGDLLQYQNYDVIHQYKNGCRAAFEVDPSTVGQYTGLSDMEGGQIFEGDIVFIPRLGKAYEVKYQLGQFYVGTNQPIAYERHSCKIIGNIHDNPEIAEGAR